MAGARHDMCELAAWHGRGTTGTRHGHSVLCVNRPLWGKYFYFRFNWNPPFNSTLFLMVVFCNRRLFFRTMSIGWSYKPTRFRGMFLSTSSGGKGEKKTCPAEPFRKASLYDQDPFLKRVHQSSFCLSPNIWRQRSSLLNVVEFLT
jgi:hypothetical protein